MADKYLWSGASGAGNGTSWTDAWTSITAVVWTSLGAGDTLWISGGAAGLTYSGNTEINNTASSEGQRVFIKTGAKHPTLSSGHDGFVTINGFVQLGGTGLGGNYLTIDGEKAGVRNMRITGSTSHGIGCRYTEHYGITIRYLEIDNNGNAFDEHGIKVAPTAENWIIEYCYIHDNFQDCINGGGSLVAGSLVARYNRLVAKDDCLQIGGGWDVYGNEIDTTDGNFEIGHPDGIQVTSGPFRCYRNKFFGKGQQIFVEPKNTRTSLRDILIYNNLIYSDPKESGVAILMSSSTPDDGVAHTWNNIRILNNTICNINGVGVRLFHPSVSSVVFGPEGMIIANNIISNPTFLFAQDAPSGGGGTFVFADGDFELKNNVFNLTAGAVQFRGTSYTSAATLNAATDASGNQFADPLIISETSNLRLQSGSPAIGKGLDFSEYFTTDYEGKPRTLPWSVGAYRYGNVYYVRKDGNDSNSGLSDDAGGAWLTCAKAASTCVAGDTCYIRAGVYAEGMTYANHGTEASPITFIGETGTEIGWVLSDKRWVRLYSVKLYGIPGNDGLFAYLANAEDNLVENCVFDRVLANYSAVNMAFNFPGVKPLRLTMRNNQFLNCTRTAELNLQGVGHLIEDNYFSAQSGQDCIRLAASYTTIRGNTFDNWSRPGGSLLHTDLIQAFSSNNEIAEFNVIEGNFAINCVDCQIGNLEDQAQDGRVANWIWRNNIFVDVDAQMSIYTPGMKFFNNVFVRCGKNGVGPLIFRDSVDRNSATGGVLRNNVFLECGNNPASTSVGWYSSTAGITDLVVSNNFVRGTGAGTVKGAGWTDPDGINGSDPLFVNAAANNYRLQAGSPLIDAGYNLASDVPNDYDGAARTGTYDIGAFTYGVSGDSTPPTPNPSTISSVTPNSATQITVVASVAVDAVSPPVEYNHSIGGVYQGWQSSPTRVFTGLLPLTAYSFRVKARDAEGNETVQSSASVESTLSDSPSAYSFQSESNIGNVIMLTGGF